ncbi:MFS transporter [secondary endosymbiont of Ctenarytaina eucalypti]|uniref:Arabinose efflux permease family protein n=1 Tax=secondary endosymbiont of Ctenarytaina eucalypti TaxID=1199245 RepID=J3TFE7_9ENTR|nr:MFS transporter [secondary endosymbiont of Ctenarytaina eucalypti]AFP84917.1 arabinose efflux permease family protein [secondary endosymbiont of Ctenarytaina eucalypti]
MQSIKLNVSAIQQLDASPLTKNQKSLICMVTIGNILEFFDLFLIGFTVTLLMQDQRWSLNTVQSSLILSGAGVGTVIGAIFWGRFADKYGRKKPFFLCVLLLVIFTGLSALTPENSWVFLSIMRIFVGIAVGGLNVTSIPYVQEFLPSKNRGFFTGLTSAFVPLGLLLGSVLTRYLAEPLGWRGMLILGCLSVIVLAWKNFIPESPRYLLSRGHVQEARAAYAWAMNRPINKIGHLSEDVYFTKKSFFNIIQDYPKQLSIVSIGSFCFMLGSFFIQSWGQTLLGNIFHFSIHAVANLFMILSLGDLIGRLVSAWLSDCFGRRRTLFLFGCMGALGCIIAALSTQISVIIPSYNLNLASSGWVFFFGILMVMIFGDGAFGVINVFGGEMFSNQIRSTCLGLGYGIGAIAKIIGPFFLGGLIKSEPLSEDSVSFPFIIFAFIFFLGSIVYLFARETRDVKLETM